MIRGPMFAGTRYFMNFGLTNVIIKPIDQSRLSRRLGQADWNGRQFPLPRQFLNRDNNVCRRRVKFVTTLMSRKLGRYHVKSRVIGVILVGRRIRLAIWRSCSLLI